MKFERLSNNELESLEKDPATFIHYSSDLGEFAKEETLRTLEYIVFEADSDIRDMVTTRRTF